MKIPIVSAKRIAEDYEWDQVIITAWRKDGTTHVTTYGKSKTDCLQAAQGGNFIKKALGWPEELCHAEPSNKVLASKGSK